MSDDWYLREDGETYGPYPKSQLILLARSGRLGPGTRVKCGEEGAWQRAADVPGLFRAADSPVGAKSQGKSGPRQSPSVPVKVIALLSAGGAALLIAVVAVTWMVISSFGPEEDSTDDPVVVAEAQPVEVPLDGSTAGDTANDDAAPKATSQDEVADASQPSAEPIEATDVSPPSEPVDADTVSIDDEPILPLLAVEDPEMDDDIAETAPIEVDTRTRTDSQITELMKRVKLNRNATNAYAQLKTFSTRYEFTETQRVRLDLELAEWQRRADSNLCRLGANWVPEREVLAAEQEARELVKNAAARLRELDFGQCIKLLKDASRVNPNGVRAEYTLGLLYSLPFAGVKAPETAERHFRNVLQRRPDHPAALNSLAIAQFKQREYGAAINSLSRAAVINPDDSAVMQNAGRFLMLAEAQRLPAPQDSVVRRCRSLYKDLTSTEGSDGFDQRVGWLHMLPVFPDEDSESVESDQLPGAPSSDSEMVALCGGTGFVISPGYVLTNRHVVDDLDLGLGKADEVRTIDPADPARKRELRGKVLTVSHERDLALIKFDGLQAPPLLLETVDVDQASDVLIMGYPQAHLLGSGLKTTRGIVSALPDTTRPLVPDYVLFDAAADHGNSGGPVVNRKGHAVAVLTVVVNTGSGLSGGEPSEVAIDFVRQHVPEFKVTSDAVSSDPEMADWAAVTKALSPSVLQLTCYYDAGVPELNAAASRVSHSGNLYEDQTCPWCNGRGHVACIYRGCISGRVSIPYYVDEVVGSGTNRQVITHKKFRREACPTCGGQGAVDCGGCSNGFDNRLQ